MDFGNAPRMAAIGSVNVPARSDIIATQGSVSVDLPPEKTVQSASAGDAVRIEIRAQTRDEQNRAAAERRSTNESRTARRADENVNDSIERRLVIEPRTGSVVLQRKNAQTGETISQLPDEALLKLRIYSRELADRAAETDEARHHLVERTA